MNEYRQTIHTISRFLRNQGIKKSDAALILGSGQSSFASLLEETITIPYREIPDLPDIGVEGHDGLLHAGKAGQRHVLAWAGRFHFYEGFPYRKTLLPVAISHAMGCKTLLVTNAAGGINDRFSVGDIMIIDDLIRPMVSFTRDTKRLYHRYDNYDLAEKIHTLAARHGIALTRGSYIYASGPSYETKAEVRAFRRIGADAVGMSTAAELMEAIRLGMSQIGLSLITNKATGTGKTKLDHSEIKDAANLSEKEFIRLISLLLTDPASPLFSDNDSGRHPA